MTVQWALAALFLYAEIIVLLLFCFPYISTERWNQIFKSRIVAAWFSSGSYYFKVVVLAMVLLLAGISSQRSAVLYRNRDCRRKVKTSAHNLDTKTR
ncbi:B-cell receptor-associated protein 31-like [Pocillopora damicornis]|uniref:B-cell receptor-associated protein 31-like n=1 Tax=Pocillopora damicornis TaxID=46731 RepID=UPI000F55345B|nr:B-cell receptor-associated protein 31-like [Pocillopora damicornis]